MTRVQRCLVAMTKVAAGLLVSSLVACASLGGGGSGRFGTTPPSGPPKLFNLDELTVAVNEARAQGKQEGLALGRMELEPATKQAFNDGTKKGEQDTLARLDKEARERAETASYKLSEAATSFVTRTSMSLLLNSGSLRADKAATMQAWQVLDLVTARLTDLGYKVRLLVPSDKVALVRQYDSGKVFLSVSDRFRGRFSDYFERMSIYDGIGLLFRLYGFQVWVADKEPLVWIGYFNAGPTPVPNASLEVRFDEEQFERRSGGR